jgi:hypothetical protein
MAGRAGRSGRKPGRPRRAEVGRGPRGWQADGNGPAGGAVMGRGTIISA